MGIDVTITQWLFGNKTMPLEVILGKKLRYGRLERYRLVLDERDEKEVLVYHPDCIGRGFSVIWHPGERKRLTLRLLMPAPALEIKHFYAAVVRMAEYWKGTLNVDGQKVTPSVFMQGLENMLAFNERVIRQISNQVLSGESSELQLYSAMWPLVMGMDEARRFVDDPAAFGEWLHEKQTMDIYHAPARFYEMDTGLRGVYVCVDECPTVYPYHPAVPFDMRDPESGKPCVCEDWKVVLLPVSAEGPIGEMDYTMFLERIGKERISRYDAGHFLMQPMSEQEIRHLLADE